MTRQIKLGAAALATFVATFTLVTLGASVAFAQGTDPAPDGGGFTLDMLRAVYQAFAGHQPALGVALGLIALVAAVKKFGSSVQWFHTDAGGSLLTLVAAGATSAVTALAVPDAKFTLSLLWSSVLVGVGAAGGYVMIKNLIIDPLLPKLPAWLKTVLTPILWIFDGRSKPAEVKVAEAVAAGQKAVAASPGAGVAAIVGSMTEVK